MLLAGESRLIITSRTIPDFVQAVSFESLAGLTAADLGEMLAANDLYFEEAQISQLHTYTGGNAQMLTLAIDLMQSGFEAQALLDQLLETDDLEDFLMDEIESRLSRNERLVMSAVAILQGYPGSQAAIEAVLDGRRQRRVIRDLSDRFLLTVTRGEGGRLYNQHAIVRDFFYEALNQRERRRMHQRAAEYYRDEEPDILLAIRHFLLGGSQTEAAVLAEENVYLLLNQGHASALDNLLRQIERGQLAARQWIAVQLVCGQVNSFLGQTEQARENFLDASNELGTIPESPETADLFIRICLGMAELLEYQDPKEALEWTKKGLLADEYVNPVLEAEITILHGTLEMHMGEFDDAQASFHAGLALLTEEPNIVRVQAFKNLAGLNFYLRQFDTGKAYAREALAISRHVHDRFEESAVLSNYGALQYVSGDWSGAIATFKEALTIARQLGNRNYIVTYEGNLGKALMYTGDYAQSRELLNDALSLAMQNGNELQAMIDHTNLAELQVRERAWEKAEAHLIAAETIANKLDTKTELPTLYSTWTEAAIGKGDLDAAVKYASMALLAAEDLDDAYESGIALYANGLAAHEAGEIAEAEEFFHKSILLLRDLDPFHTARSMLALGSLLMKRTEGQEEAREYLVTAVHTFSTLGAKPDLQQAKQVLAQLNKNQDI